MELGARKQQILKACVEAYVQSAEPVSSKAVMEGLTLGLSSATIRNEMSELTELGLLEQPHTSAGRVPTALGYRIYVNALMGKSQFSDPIAKQQVDQGLVPKSDSFEQVVADAVKLASEMTFLPSYALQAPPGEVSALRFEFVYIDPHNFIIVILLSNKSVQNRLVSFPGGVRPELLNKLATLFNANFSAKIEGDLTYELIAATERAAGDTGGLTAVIAGFLLEMLMKTKVSHTALTGTSHLFNRPEFQDVGRARRVLGYLSNEQELLRLPAPEDGSVKILIGPENIAEELKDSSVVIAKYDAGDNMQGIIGVLGPTRMDYAKVAARLTYIADGIKRALVSDFPTELGPTEQGENIK